MKKTLCLAALLSVMVPVVVTARDLPQGGTLTLAQPAQKAEFLIDGAVWACDGTACRSNFVDDMPALRSCKRVVAATGAVTAFTWRGKVLSADELRVCNTRAKA